jgi:hypothetical protein
LRVDNPIKREGKHVLVGTIANCLPYGHGKFYRVERTDIAVPQSIMAIRLTASGRAKAALRPFAKLAFPLDSDDLYTVVRDWMA